MTIVKVPTDEEILETMKKKSSKSDEIYNNRKLLMSQAEQSDDGGWTKHTQFHWSRMVAGHKLDYWPSRKKFQYRGKIRRCDVNHFIRYKASNMMLQSQNSAKSMVST